MRELQTFVETARLPVMPAVATKLIPLLGAEHVELTYLRDVIATDPTLTATVLRWANSPLHGLPRTVTTLDAAISILGLSKIRAQAIGLCVAHAFALPPGMDRNTFWANGMKCAGYSMWLALAVGLNESKAWLTGMLLPLGQVLLRDYAHAQGRTLPAMDLPLPARWLEERTALGFDEGQAMGEATQVWHFPDKIVRALQSVASPMQATPFSSLAAVVHLAALLAQQDAVNPDTLSALPPDVTARLGLDLAWLSQHIPSPDTFLDTSGI